MSRQGLVMKKINLVIFALILSIVIIMTLPLTANAHNPHGALGITLTPTLKGENPTETNTPVPTNTPEPTNTPVPTATKSKKNKGSEPSIVLPPAASPTITPTMIIPNGLPAAGAGMSEFLIAIGLAGGAIAAGVMRRHLGSKKT
jgi:hypothetical protein